MTPRAATSPLRYVIVAFACTLCALRTPAQSVRLQAREAIERHLKSFSTENIERETLIRKWLAEAGCAGANLSEQALGRKLPPRDRSPRDLPPNVICVLPGQTREAIVVGAHTDHVDRFGDGVVDNWTGAVLLPALLYSLNAEPRHHTLIFVGFSAEEKGLLGSRYYADHLSSDDRARIEAMVNFDSLGLGPTEVWASHADRALLDELEATARSNKLSLAVMNPENGATADSESFAPYHIPRITLHSVTDETWPILHSPRDKLAVIRMNDYYDSYKLIAAYLADLDQALKPTANQRAHSAPRP